MDYKNFEEKGLENLNIMKESGFLKRQGYSKNSWWKIVTTILGILFVGSIFFIGYSIYDGKFQITANPNILCEGSEFTCPEQICDCGKITCEPAVVNITINPSINTGA